MARTRSPLNTNLPKVTDVENTPNGVQAAAYPLRGYPQDNDLGRNIVDTMMNGDSHAVAMQAWGYYKTVPELHFLATYLANAMSMVRLYIGEVDASDPENPTEVGPRHPARDLMRNFAGGQQGQGELLGRLATHLTVVGDSVLIGPSPTAGVLPHPYDTWRVYSSSEVNARSGRVYLKDPNFREQQIPASTMPVRIWRPDPQYWWKADSPVYSAFGVLREIGLMDAHIHASAISRLKSAGILFIPEEFTLPGDEVEIDGEDGDPFVRVLVEVMQLAIKNPESAAALVPIILRGPAEFSQAIRLINFENAFDQQVSNLRTEAIRRLALAMDTPPEILLGSGSSSGWSMWQVSEATERMHVRPLAHLICASLTEGWLKPALAELPLADQTRDNVPNLVVWPDFTQLRIQIDPSADVNSLYQNLAISSDTYRHHLGFGEDEKPTPEEVQYELLLQIIKTNPQLTPWAVEALNKDFGFTFPKPDEIATPSKGIVSGQVPAGDLSPVQTAQVKVGEQPAKPGAGGLGTPPKPATPGTAPKIPGDRSRAKQTEPPTPTDIKNANNNTPK